MVDRQRLNNDLRQLPQHITAQLSLFAPCYPILCENNIVQIYVISIYYCLKFKLVNDETKSKLTQTFENPNKYPLSREWQGQRDRYRVSVKRWGLIILTVIFSFIHQNILLFLLGFKHGYLINRVKYGNHQTKGTANFER